MVGVHLYASDLPLLVALAAWIAGHALDPARPLQPPPRSINVPMIALVILASVSIPIAPSPALAAEFTLRLMCLALLALLAAGEIDDPRSAAAALVTGAVVQSAIAALQVATQSSLGLGWLGEQGAVIDQPGLWVRGSGLGRHPNILGGYLLAGLMAALGLAWTAGGRLPGRQSALALAAFSLVTAGLLATFSRSAWMGALAGLTMIAAALATRPSDAPRPSDVDGPSNTARTFARCLVAGAIVTAAFVAARPGWFQSRLVVPVQHWLAPALAAPPPADHVEVTNLDMRAGYDRVARTLIAARPWRGAGAGNFAIASARLEPDLPPAHAYLPVHNVPLLVTAELGALGGAAWLALVVGAALAVAREWRVLAGSPWRLAWSAALLGLFVTSVWDSYLWSWQYGRALLFATLGLWSAAGPRGDSGRSHDHGGAA